MITAPGAAPRAVARPRASAVFVPALPPSILSHRSGPRERGVPVMITAPGAAPNAVAMPLTLKRPKTP